MNFGPGTSNQPRNSILRRDPELMPVALNPARPSLHNVPQRNNRRLTDARPVTRPVFVIKKSARTTGTTSILPRQRESTESPKKLGCPICFGGITPVSVMKPKATMCCGYVFCKQCIMRCMTNFKKCPMCNQKLGPNCLLSLRVFSG